MRNAKFIVSGVAAVSAIAGISLASAADLPGKAPALVVPAFSWTGFYIGANAGYFAGKDSTSIAADPVGWGAAGAANINLLTPGFVNPNGFIGGGQIGYNWQVNDFLLGIEADASYRDQSTGRAFRGFTTVNLGDAFTTTTQARFLGTVRPRIGWAVDHALLYLTGGLAVTNAKFSDSFGAFGNTVVAAVSSDTTRTGWTVGVGIEYAFTNNWSAKAEYLYADFGSFTQSIPSCVGCAVGSDISVTHKYTENIFRYGLNYKFDWASPVLAKY
jgi:outer membrane immunogenic protein